MRDRPRPWALSFSLSPFLSTVNNAERYCVSMPIPTLTSSDNSVALAQLPIAMAVNLSRGRARLSVVITCREPFIVMNRPLNANTSPSASTICAEEIQSACKMSQ